MKLHDLVAHYAMFGFLGWTAENLANLNTPDFLSCNGLAHYLSKKICWVPFPIAHGLGGLAWYAFWRSGGSQQPLLHRIVFYAIAFNAIEYVGGAIAQHVVCPRMGSCQRGSRMWHYTGLGSIHGHIDLPHTIAWVALGLLAERIYPILAKRNATELIAGGLFAWLAIHLYKAAIRRR
jgi:uncharacterized membrane protein